MKRRLIRSYRRFAAAQQGIAAVEFALIMPVMVVMLLATYDGGRAISAYMKMRAATYALAEMTNQYATIASADMTNIMGAGAAVMAPFSTAPAIKISQITTNGSGVSKYGWSAALNATAHTIPSSASPPSGTVVNGGYLILAEVTYTYTPLFGFFGSSSSITFSDNLYVTPRGVTCVIYTPQSATC
jgi:Flp pilus assembly protein TadG